MFDDIEVSEEVSEIAVASEAPKVSKAAEEPQVSIDLLSGLLLSRSGSFHLTTPYRL
jgi:hypothetical protein